MKQAADFGAEIAHAAEKTAMSAQEISALKFAAEGAGVGFDARVMKNIVPWLKRAFGRTGYSWTATLEWLKYEFPPIEVTGFDSEGAPFVARATFVLAANTRRYGGDPIMSPFAVIIAPSAPHVSMPIESSVLETSRRYAWSPAIMF